MPSAHPHYDRLLDAVRQYPPLRVAEEFAQFFPNARYSIASSDTLHGPAETQAAIRAMAKREMADSTPVSGGELKVRIDVSATYEVAR